MLSCPANSDIKSNVNSVVVDLRGHPDICSVELLDVTGEKVLFMESVKQRYAAFYGLDANTTYVLKFRYDSSSEKHTAKACTEQYPRNMGGIPGDALVEFLHRSRTLLQNFVGPEHLSYEGFCKENHFPDSVNPNERLLAWMEAYGLAEEAREAEKGKVERRASEGEPSSEPACDSGAALVNTSLSGNCKDHANDPMLRHIQEEQGRTAKTSASSKAGSNFTRVPDGGILSNWFHRRQGDFLWTLFLTEEVMLELYLNACYTLPGFLPEPLCAVINPEERFCIDLRSPQACGFHRSKMVRRHRKDFTMSVNCDFAGALKKLQQYHKAPEKSGNTWLTDDLIKLTVSMEMRRAELPLRHTVFEVWEADDLVAVCAGFAVGRAYHDYSMATLRRDPRGIGHIATKAVADLLVKCGYEIWYWGCCLGYMEDYKKYGGRNFPRDEFRDRWLGAVYRGILPTPLPEEALKRRHGDGVSAHEVGWPAIGPPRDFTEALQSGIGILAFHSPSQKS